LSQHSKAQRGHTLGLRVWPEFTFGSLAQNGVQDLTPPNLDVKFRISNTYAENISVIAGHRDSCFSEECTKMDMSNKTGVLLNFRYVKVRITGI
jgi:hypothetical protein